MDEVLSPPAPTPDPDHAAHVVQAIARAHRDVPFYTKKSRAVPETPANGEAKLPELLASLPVLTKTQVRATLPKQWVGADVDLKAELASGGIEIVPTGGSTAERLRILWDRGWWMKQERRAMRVHPDIAKSLDADNASYREAVLTAPFGAVGSCHSGDPPPDERTEGDMLFLNTRQDPTFWTDTSCERMLDELESHGTVGLESDPMYAAVLARHAAKKSRKLGIKGFLKLTYASATAGDLRAIRRVYEGPIVQLYGATETGVLFMEAEDGLLHHVPFTTHVELLPARVPTPGAENVALVVVTTLDRKAQPLVRFVVGDLVQVAHDGPRRYTSVAPLRSVEGRVQDALVRPDGAIVTAGAIDRALDFPGVSRFQANQATADHVDVDLLTEEGADGAKVCDEARARLLPLFEGLTTSVRTAQALAIESSGRVRLSRRQIPLDLVRSFEGYTEETTS